jgi:hypothetical protein
MTYHELRDNDLRRNDLTAFKIKTIPKISGHMKEKESCEKKTYRGTSHITRARHFKHS